MCINKNKYKVIKISSKSYVYGVGLGPAHLGANGKNSECGVLQITNKSIIYLYIYMCV